MELNRMVLVPWILMTKVILSVLYCTSEDIDRRQKNCHSSQPFCRHLVRERESEREREREREREGERERDRERECV